MSRKLHIGGKEYKEGWEILNIMDGAHIDHLGDAKNMALFEDDSFMEIYSSHTLEHFSYKMELQQVLKEWYRILKVGGRLYVSVPDLERLCEMFLDKKKTFKERFYIMRMMYGGQINEFDFHYTGFSEGILTFYLKKAGFKNIKKVESLNKFNDCSSKVYSNKLISLNLISEKL